MKKIAIVLFMMLPAGAFADHLDVIEVKLSEGCSVQSYVAIKDDFNKTWANKYGYQAEIIVPIQSHNLVSLYWVGRSANAGTFGKAWDQWRNDLANPDSIAAKLAARFEKCGMNISRRGYDTY